MAEHQVKLPSFGEDAGEEATVSFFYVDPGETIDQDEPLAQMVTDKATFDVPSPVAGTLKSIEVEENHKVNVGDLLAVIETGD